MRNDERRQKHDIAAAWIAYGLFLLLVVAASAALSASDRTALHAGSAVQTTAPDSASDYRPPREATLHAVPPHAVD